MSEAIEKFAAEVVELFRKDDADWANKSLEVDTVKAAQDFYRALASADLDKVKATITDDISFVLHGPSDFVMAGKTQGKDDYLKLMMANFAMLKNQVPEALRVVAQGNTVIVFYRDRGQVLATGKDYDVQGVHTLEFRGKQICRMENLFDTASLRCAMERSIPVLTDQDIHLWHESRFFKSYDKLGCHLCQNSHGVEGAHFAVWAPSATKVSVIGDFNDWEEDKHPLTFSSQTGVWSGFLAGVGVDALYKYAITSAQDGYQTHRADPYAFAAQLRPQTASRVVDLETYTWADSEWMERRSLEDPEAKPVSIYEVHLGSWKREDGEWLSYREMAPLLADYVTEMGYTHVELMPVSEHPFDGSWGYQVTGYFAATARFGEPQDLMFMIDTLHQRGVGVILDWVPAHFPKDRFALAFFDGTHLYEHADPRQGEHPEWGTCIFNYGRPEVFNFLISSALFWLDKYHIDGIRVDAVASMLYLDYGREGGDYVANKDGGRENLEAIEFLKNFNQAVNTHYPGVFTMAEESTAWPFVTGCLKENGLGFTFKWNMGWMNDTLDYFEQDPVYRKYHHGKLTFGMMYQYSEKFALPLSHDEVVHLKKALLTKMPGADWQRFANLRLLYGYKMGFPGKKLLFMGGEFGQWAEWNFESELDWHLLEQPAHKGVQEWVKALNLLYRNEPALYQLDSHPDGFEWIHCDDSEQSLLSFLRFAEGQKEALLFLCNFTPIPREDYQLGLPWPGDWELKLCSTDELYGGRGTQPQQKLSGEKQEHHGRNHSTTVTIPPLAVLIYRGVRPEGYVEETPEFAEEAEPATA